MLRRFGGHFGFGGHLRFFHEDSTDKITCYVPKYHCTKRVLLSALSLRVKFDTNPLHHRKGITLADHTWQNQISFTHHKNSNDAIDLPR